MKRALSYALITLGIGAVAYFVIGTSSVSLPDEMDATSPPAQVVSAATPPAAADATVQSGEEKAEGSQEVPEEVEPLSLEYNPEEIEVAEKRAVIQARRDRPDTIYVTAAAGNWSYLRTLVSRNEGSDTPLFVETKAMLAELRGYSRKAETVDYDDLYARQAALAQKIRQASWFNSETADTLAKLEQTRLVFEATRQ